MSHKHNITLKNYIAKHQSLFTLTFITCLLTGLFVLYNNLGDTHSSIQPTVVSDLPIEELPTSANKQDFFVIILSGDGGWTQVDQSLATALSAHGVNVAGMDSLKYFWLKKSRAQASADLEAMIRYYQAKWKTSKFVLIGYSFGAEVLPYLIDKFSADIHNQIIKTIMIGASCCATFEIHLTDILHDYLVEHGLSHPDAQTSPGLSLAAKDSGMYIPYQIAETPDLNFTCIYGEGDGASICPLLDATSIRVKKLKGGHHFNHNYSEMVKAVEADINKPT